MKKIIKICIALLITFISFHSVVMINQTVVRKKITIKNNMDVGNIIIRGILVNGVSINLESLNYLELYDKESNTIIINPQRHIEIEEGVSDYLEIYFTSVEDTSSVEVTDNKINELQILKLGELKNELGEYIFKNFYSKRQIWNIFLQTLNIKKFVINVGIVAILFGIYYFIINQIEIFLNNGKKSYKIGEIVKIGILFFILLFNIIYTILDALSIIWISIIIAILFIMLIKKVYKAPIHNVYTVLAIFVGILMLFILPMFRVPDEFCHFTNIYAKSLLPKEMLGGTYGEELVLFDKELEETFFSFQGGYGGDFLKGRLYFRKFYHDMSTNMDSGYIGTIYNWYANTANLSVLPYIPGIIVTTVLRHMPIPAVALLLAIRLVNFLITVILGYISLKIIPIWKKYLFIILMLPIFIQQAFGMNQDSLTNALFILAFAIMINFIKKEELITKKKILLLLGILIAISYCKLGYAPIVLLILLIPNKRLGEKHKGIIYKVSILMIIFAINILNYKLMMPSEGTVSWYNYNSVKDVLLNPVETIVIYLRTFINRFEWDFFTGLINGTSFNYWTIEGMVQLVSLSIIIILLFTSAQDEDFIRTKNFYIIVITIFGTICGLIYTSLWCGYTVKGSAQVNGLQPRYFIPCAMLLYILCSNTFIKINVKEEKRNIILYGGMGFIGWAALLTIMIHAYVFL